MEAIRNNIITVATHGYNLGKILTSNKILVTYTLVLTNTMNVLKII